MKLIPPVPGPPLGLPDPLRRIQLPADLDPHAFGHLGFTNILAWADGEQATSVAVINRGKPIVYAEFYRFLGTMQHITTTMPKAPEAERFL